MVKVMLGAPVRDRAWILPRFIKHIKESDLTGIELSSMFIVNDCSDNTADLLEEAGFNFKRVNNLPSKTSGSIRGQYSYSHLANLRNALLEEFLESDCEFLLSIDTDILVPTDGIRKLVENNRDICSMILCNQAGSIGYRAHNIMEISNNGYYKHILRWDEGEIIPVDLTGAVYLIRREVVEAGVRYAHSTQGEDIPFCLKAQRKGFDIYCDTSLKPIHVMAQGVELIGGCKEAN